MAGGSRKGTRKRWASKTMSGCFTCKRRRIKCDEQRPGCQRCAIRGVQCQGYADNDQGPSNPSFTVWKVLTKHSDVFAAAVSAQDKSSTSSECSQTPEKSLITSTTTYQDPISNAFTFSPYKTTDEQWSLKFWLDKMAPLMTKTDVGAYIWPVAIPTIAWTSKPLRTILSATAILIDSLLRRDSLEDYEIAHRKAVVLANKTIRELLTEKDIPPEVTILTSTVFWILDMAMGNPGTAVMHVASGVKIANQIDTSKMSDPLVAKFMISCIDGLIGSVNPDSILSKSDDEVRRQTKLRSRFAARIIQHASSTLRSFQNIIGARETPNQAEALAILHDLEVDFQWVLSKWPPDLIDEDLDTPLYVEKVIQELTPFSFILNRLVAFLETDDIVEVTKFDVEFKTSLEHFMWLAASQSLSRRQDLYIMNVDPNRPRRLSKRFPGNPG